MVLPGLSRSEKSTRILLEKERLFLEYKKRVKETRIVDSEILSFSMHIFHLQVVSDDKCLKNYLRLLSNMNMNMSKKRGLDEGRGQQQGKAR